MAEQGFALMSDSLRALLALFPRLRYTEAQLGGLSARVDYIEACGGSPRDFEMVVDRFSKHFPDVRCSPWLVCEHWGQLMSDDPHLQATLAVDGWKLTWSWREVTANGDEILVTADPIAGFATEESAKSMAESTMKDLEIVIQRRARDPLLVIQSTFEIAVTRPGDRTQTLGKHGWS